MIKNERQFRITRSAAEKFERLISELEQADADGVRPDLLRVAELSGLRSQLADLRTQIEEYERLKSGHEVLLETLSLSALPQAIVKARIAAGLSHKELADRLNLKEQQIQKYEATDYAGASVSRLLQVAEALALRIRKDLFLPSRIGTSFDVFKRLAEMGIEKNFVLHRLVSPSGAQMAQGIGGSTRPEVVFEATAAASHIFGWTPEAIVGSDTLFISQGVLGAARFKVNKRSEQKRLSAFTFYAHYLALQLLEATTLPIARVPTDFRRVRSDVIKKYGEITFQAVLNYAWDLGGAVLPLKDTGAFHGAMWRIRGRNVLILKQSTMSLDRWLHDLLHELFHASQEPELPERSIVEAPEASQQRRESDEEWDATQFAADVVMDGRAEGLARECVDATKERWGRSGSVERLKVVVPAVAKRANVPVGALANYMAFRLSLQDIDWWGAAQNLQDVSVDPWVIARDVLLQRAQLGRLHGLDRELFIRALTEWDVAQGS
ncbi:MAG TPA: XRE family transcriptional regulator [Lacipirellulaceae bacterium]|nr:XRE family transcriptional regulator [Lacipirellulaceae bacterium]